MRLRTWEYDAAALLSGGILPLAFAPLAWWPVAIASLWLLQIVIAQGSTRRALWRALLFGVGYFGGGVSWVYVSISLFGNVAPPLAAALTVLFILVISGYIVLIGYLLRVFDARGFGALAALPCTWTLIEWLRGWLFSGFSWLDIGYAFIDSPISAYAPYIGASGISFLVALSASSFYVFFDQNRLSSTMPRVVSAALLVLIWLPPLLVTLPAQTYVYQQPLTAALLQGNVPQQQKWRDSERQKTLELYRKMTEAHYDKQLIIWPETAVPAYEDEVSGYLQSIHDAARSNNAHVLLGIPVRESHGDRYYNALSVLGNTSRNSASLYKKRHLVPFGEYLPLRPVLGAVLDSLKIPLADFTAGDTDKPLVTVGEHRVGVLICFEITFADEVHEAMPEAAYLVNVSNDAWFGDSLAPYQHLQIARMRALETGRDILRATNTGITAIIGADGRVRATLEAFQTGVLDGYIQPMQGSTFYTRYANYPLLTLLALLFVILSISIKKSKSKRR